MHARWSAHTAVVADEHVKILQVEEEELGESRSHFPQPASSTLFLD